MKAEPLFAIGSRTMASVMPRPPRHAQPLQLDMFEMSPPPPGTPAWTALPDPTRQVLTGLGTRMLVAHADAAATLSGSDGDGR